MPAPRDFWELERGVKDLACLQRFANFARIYPRYRDLVYLRAFMPQWDSAIKRLIAHDRSAYGSELPYLMKWGAAMSSETESLD
jgi:hypothetical protein